MAKPNDIIIDGAIHGRSGTFTVAESGRMILGDKELAYLKDINPYPTSDFVYDASELIDFPSKAGHSVVLFRNGLEGGQNEIAIRADDTSGHSGDLTLTVTLGFGPQYDKFVDVTNVDKTGDGQYTTSHYVVEMKAETDTTNATIYIPAECNNFEARYFMGDSSPLPPGPTPPIKKTSYWIDTKGAYHKFSIEDTPFENFASPSSEFEVTINGVTVQKSDILEVVFGLDFDTVTTVDPLSRLFNRFTRMTNLCLPRNLSFFGGGFCTDCVDLNNIVLPQTLTEMGIDCIVLNRNMRSFIMPDSVTTVGSSLLEDAYKLRTVKVSNNLLNMGSAGSGLRFFFNCPDLLYVYLGSIDASKLLLRGTNPETVFGDPHNYTPTRFHDTQELADTWYDRFPAVRDWNVVIGVNDSEINSLYNYSWLV